ncbi:hypothetical protein BN961_02146 [Afipia felis]|uniref:Uncharacterized protein n=1 Tax=Afipia felis TaxID=1035 RepID=A0A090N7J8_AFIFE|nr:hypothetical protein [Afipia felis]CEG08728.1 hypothetical protein BN961_02146 [Afipia felis]
MNEIESLKHQISILAAEGLAMQFLLTCIFQRVGEAQPSTRSIIMQAFDDAANHAEQFSISGGSKAGHLPETLRIIEQMRMMLVGKGKPHGEVHN